MFQAHSTTPAPRDGERVGELALEQAGRGLRRAPGLAVHVLEAHEPGLLVQVRLLRDLGHHAVPEQVVVVPPGVDGRVVERLGMELLRGAVTRVPPSSWPSVTSTSSPGRLQDVAQPRGPARHHLLRELVEVAGLSRLRDPHGSSRSRGRPARAARRRRRSRRASASRSGERRRHAACTDPVVPGAPLVRVADGPVAPEPLGRRVGGLVDEVPVDPAALPGSGWRPAASSACWPSSARGSRYGLRPAEGRRQEREEVEADDDAVARGGLHVGLERGQDALVDSARVQHRARPGRPEPGAHEVDAARLHLAEVAVPDVRVGLEQELAVDVRRHVRRADDGEGRPSRGASRATR